MWHKPQLMNAVSDLLFVAAVAALLVAAVVWGMRMPWFPVREVVVMHELQEVRRSEIERSLAGLMLGNFFSINLESLRLSLEKLPWVRHAELRRQWPARLEVRIEEHRPAAHWGDGTNLLVNTFGEVFGATLSRDVILPRLSGPSGSSAEVLRYYEEFARTLRAIGRQPERVVLSSRLAWFLKLDDGMLVELGREQAKAPIGVRMQRFVEYYPILSDARRGRPVAVDMRYPNGFALKFAGSAGGASNEVRGKQ